MIESDIPSIMSGIIRNSGQNHHPSQEYRLLASDPSQLSEDELPGDLQSLSWLTSVDVPRLQQMASGRMDFSLGIPCLPLSTPGAVGSAMHSTPGAMIHVQASLPQGILGLNSISTHGANMSPYAVGGQLSPGLQTQQQLFPPHPHPPPPHPQQCNPAAIYNTSYGTQPHYSQPRLAPHSAQELHPKHYPKPIYSYSCLIAMALKNSKTGSLPVSEIYSFMKEHFPYFKTAPDGWKNSVRHNLSLNKCFEKVENKLSGTSRKGCLWALNPAKIDKMEEEMQKWKRKDLAAIHRSMANPGRAHIPHPAHPWHSLHGSAALGLLPLGPRGTWGCAAVSRIPSFPGNIWEEMKDDSFSLDTLGAFSNSPLHLSDCELGTPGLTPASSGSDRSFSDLQVTGLYTTYTTLDNVAAAQYMNPQGNKPIPLL
uniref:Forkhead box N4 n=1 Tax=Zonotrichia albicollis TaxID=44394 RepID=A0A8D2MXD1_ZONAL